MVANAARQRLADYLNAQDQKVTRGNIMNTAGIKGVFTYGRRTNSAIDGRYT